MLNNKKYIIKFYLNLNKNVVNNKKILNIGNNKQIF